MTTTNLIGIRYGEESPLGTPATQLRTCQYTGEELTLRNTFIESEEIRSDRQPLGTTLVDAEVVGPLRGYLRFKEHDELIAAGFANSWSLTPVKDNAGTADSVVTQVTDSSDTYTVASGGDTFKAGMLARATGFTNSANNQIFKVTSSSDTTVVGTSLTLTDESAPPAAARLKCVGFQGAAGDITATSGGLGSTLLDFTTLGLVPYQWIKIGGTATGDKFATSQLNDWVRVTAIAANSLTCDNKPATWTTDNGATKTIKVWFGDVLRNSNVKRAFTYEKAFLGHNPVNYLVFNGLMVSTLTFGVRPGQPVTVEIAFSGRTANAPTTTPIDASVENPVVGAIMNGVTDVGRLAVGGTPVVGPNYIQEITFSLNNNILQGKAVGVLGSAVVELGKLGITGTAPTYFGDTTMWTAVVNNTKTSISFRTQKDSQAYVFDVPAIRLRGDAPTSPRANQFSNINTEWVAEFDSTINYTAQINRLEYYE